MQIEPSTPTVKNPPDKFAGDVWLDGIAAPHTDDQRMTVATVRFAPGARTAWHSHARGQYIRVTQGVARSATPTTRAGSTRPADGAHPVG